MKKHATLMIYLLLIVWSFPASAQIVSIPDDKLRAVIEEHFGYPPDFPITKAAMEQLEVLYAEDANINDLTGLEGATNLTFLNLQHNNISDISPLEELTKLTALLLSGNQIEDIGPLAELTNLTTLELSRNNILDISPVARLIDLEALSLTNSAISDISLLAGLTNLTFLWLDGNQIEDIGPLAGLTNLTRLRLRNNAITDISPVSGLTNLTALSLGGNQIEDISAVSGLINLIYLHLSGNNVSDLSPLVDNTEFGEGDEVNVRGNPLNDASINTHIPALLGKGVAVESDMLLGDPVNILDPYLRAAIERDLGKARGVPITTVDMKRLKRLRAPNANITNLTGLEAATTLTWLILGIDESVGPEGRPVNSNSISDLSPLVGLTNLTLLDLEGNSISDISHLAELTNLTELRLSNNAITHISAVTGLTNLRWLTLVENNISDISAVAELTQLTRLWLRNNSISDLSPLVENMGLGAEDLVDVSENPLDTVSINTHIPALQSRGVRVFANDLKPTTLEYTLSLSLGYNLIHVPLKVTAVGGVAQTIESIADVYDALGGANDVKLLLTFDSHTQEAFPYILPSDKGTPNDRELTDDMGIFADMKVAKQVRLTGSPLGTNGSSTITLNPELNFVGLPLNDSRLTHVSDLLTLEGIAGNAPVVIFTDNGEIKVVPPGGGPDDSPLIGGQAFILDAQRAATVPISGDAWTNDPETAAAPPLILKGIEVGDTTPVLGLRGAIVDEETGLNKPNFRVTVKNLSTGRAVAGMTKDEVTSYQLAVVDIETARAATVGDILEISAQSPDASIGVQPLRYIVTAEDVKRSWIQLPELVVYEIPAETELLANYPNPFNPETWIPYRLAEDAFVTLTIYDGTGQVVRTLDMGHQTAAVYENRSKAIYWDGRNHVGEQVASGVYFYHLSAGDYSATRKLVILK